MAQNVSEMARSASTVSILWGALLIVLGIMAITAPFLAAVAVSVVISWLILFAGVVHIVLAFHAHGAGSVIWRLLVGVAYLAFGGYMLVHPVLSVASLTLVLGALFVIEGVLDLILWFRTRTLHAAGWLLLDGIITLLLGGMIYMQWPSSSAWAIGTLVGVSLMISGVSRIGMTMALRKALAAPSSVNTRLAA
ncbi:MAG: HdeD family acid-resistance protein [Candidatus Sulfotelmatobacter sp.]